MPQYKHEESKLGDLESITEKANQPSPESSQPQSNPTSQNNPNEFTIFLRKTADNNRLGLAADTSNGVCLVVHTIDGGIMGAYNDANPSSPIRPGDRIMSVNGWIGDAKELT